MSIYGVIFMVNTAQTLSTSETATTSLGRAILPIWSVLSPNTTTLKSGQIGKYFSIITPTKCSTLFGHFLNITLPTVVEMAAPFLVKNVGVFRNISSSTSAKLARGFNRALVATSNTVASLTHSIPVLLSAIATASLNTFRNFNLARFNLTFAEPTIASFGFGFTKTLSAVATNIASLIRNLQKTLLTATSATTPTLFKTWVKTLAVNSITIASTLIGRSIGVLLKYSSSGILTFNKSISKIITTTETASLSLVRSINKVFNISEVTVNNLYKTIPQKLSTISTSVASWTRAISKTIYTASPTTILTAGWKVILKTFTITESPTAILSRGLSRVLSVANSATASLGRGFMRTLQTNVNSIPSYVKNITRNVFLTYKTVVSPVISKSMSLFFTTLSTTVNSVVSMLRDWGLPC